MTVISNQSIDDAVRFSIIIPSHNYAHFLPRAIDSAVSQPGDDYEVIVINDGSSDNTDAIVLKYLNDHDHHQLSYYNQDNLGVSVARNRGVELSRGQFLIFLDADDELISGALNSLRPISQAKPDAGLLIGGHYTAFKDGSKKLHNVKPLKPIRKNNFFNYLKKKISMANGAVAINRLVFEKIKYPDDLPQSEDIPVFGQAFANFDCYSIPDPLVCIHRHDGSRRSDVDSARKGGFQVVDYLFNPDLLPLECMPYRNYFYVRKCLSLFRRFYKAGAYQEAKTYYHKAFLNQPLTTLRLSYLRKYLRILMTPKNTSSESLIS